MDAGIEGGPRQGVVAPPDPAAQVGPVGGHAVVDDGDPQRRAGAALPGLRHADAPQVPLVVPPRGVGVVRHHGGGATRGHGRDRHHVLAGQQGVPDLAGRPDGHVHVRGAVVGRGAVAGVGQDGGDRPGRRRGGGGQAHVARGRRVDVGAAGAGPHRQRGVRVRQGVAGAAGSAGEGADLERDAPDGGGGIAVRAQLDEVRGHVDAELGDAGDRLVHAGCGRRAGPAGRRRSRATCLRRAVTTTVDDGSGRACGVSGARRAVGRSGRRATSSRHRRAG